MRVSSVRMFAAELCGIDARIVEVEVDIRIGLHSFVIVGLVDRALNEARERVNAALGAVGVKPPHRENRKITVNLAPADTRKTGSCYDLAIALAYLRASGQLATFDEAHTVCIGELALDGRVRAIRGALNIADRAQREGFRILLLPRENAGEAAAITGIRIVPISHISEAIAFLAGACDIAKPQQTLTLREPATIVDLADIRGHAHAKRALIIAAAGGHNLLMQGPPGVGKSMLAQAIPGILPPLSTEESIEVTKIYSAAGLMLASDAILHERPVRMPHHGTSVAALIGGGPEPLPGEISLAHRGVLFLDELPEFPRHVLNVLRQPIESKEIRVSRAKQRVTFPANFILLAAMNPCPCGYYADPRVACSCTAQQVVQYIKKISGPLLDRMDLVVRMERVDTTELEIKREPLKKESPTARALVARARETQRIRNGSVEINSDLTVEKMAIFANLTTSARSFLKQTDLRHVSPRGYYRLVKVARTIADMEGSLTVGDTHLAEAYTYRFRDRPGS